MEEHATKRRFRFGRPWLVLVVAITGILLGFAIRYMLRESARGWSVGRLERAIQAEASAMSDRQQVQSWLTAHGIRYVYSTDTAGEERHKVAAAAGLQDEDLKGVVVGWIDGEEANLGLLSTGYIRVSFFFNHDDHCIGHDIFAFCYSL